MDILDDMEKTNLVFDQAPLDQFYKQIIKVM